ncbi:regulator of chromosome condensation 1/beta-lactamase-inhibitor protein II, partial [Baffinella frigidus]
VKCWGYNLFGQLGLGDSYMRGFLPNGLPDTTTPRETLAVSAGLFHSCALLDDATVKCWGRNISGQLGLGDKLNRGDGANEMGTNLASVDLGAGRTAKAVSAGTSHSCALLDDATVKCWGLNADGQLGLGDTSSRGDDANEMGTNLASVDLGAGRTAVAVSAGTSHTCALLDDATVKCWGLNADGQLGLGDRLSRGDDANGPCLSLSHALSLALSLSLILPLSLLLSLSRLPHALPHRVSRAGPTCPDPGSCSPRAEMGTNLASVDLGAGRTAKAVSAGTLSCALLDDATVKCWGVNNYGQLGLGDRLSRGDDANAMGTNLPSADLGAGRTCTALAPRSLSFLPRRDGRQPFSPGVLRLLSRGANRRGVCGGAIDQQLCVRRCLHGPKHQTLNSKP